MYSYLLTPRLIRFWKQTCLISLNKSFVNLDYVDDTLLYTMSRYISAKLKSNSLSLDILLQSLDCCKFARNIEDKLLRAASEHFIKHYKSYSHKQVHMLMSVYSFLSYIPADYLNFFNVSTKKFLIFGQPHFRTTTKIIENTVKLK